MGTVTGVITKGDTQRPARFAKVTLTPVKSSTPDMKKLSEKDAKDDPAAAMQAMTAMMGAVTMLQGQTGLDGTYTISNVAPGDYYLSPSAPGYVSPMAAAQAAAPGAKKPITGVTVVHVEANHTSRGDAVMERGAALNGTVVFDDGTPAAGVTVRFEDAKAALAKKGEDEGDDDMPDLGQTMSLAMSGGMVMATTDDRGRFRLAGIAPGEYIVQATVTVHSVISMRAGVMDMSAMKGAGSLEFYAPGTLSKKEAAKITLRSGEERGDVDVKVDLSAMRTVSGRVASAVDHHGLNAGTVTLIDTTDKKRASHWVGGCDRSVYGGLCSCGDVYAGGDRRRGH